MEPMMSADPVLILQSTLASHLRPSGGSLLLGRHLLAMPLSMPQRRGATRVIHLHSARLCGYVAIQEPHTERWGIRVQNIGPVPVFLPLGARLRATGRTHIVDRPALVLPGEERAISTHGLDSSLCRIARRRLSQLPASTVLLRRERLARPHDRAESSMVAQFTSQQGTISGLNALEAALRQEQTRLLIQSTRRAPEERETIEDQLLLSGGVALRRPDGTWRRIDLFGAPAVAAVGSRLALEAAELEAGVLARTWRASVEPRHDLAAVRDHLASARWVARSAGAAVQLDLESSTGLRGTAMVYDRTLLQASLAIE
jgi:hypothetical protein